MLPTLAAASLVDAATGMIFAFVGHRISRRTVTGDAKRATLAFAVWWYAVSLNALATGARGFAAALGAEGRGPVPAAFASLSYVTIAGFTVGVAGLLYYLVYLLTGRDAWFGWIVAFYAAYGVVALASLARLRPEGVAAGKWFASVTYGSTLGAGFYAVMALFLLLPQIGGAIAYAALYPRLARADQRYRVAVVSTSLLVWLGLALVAPLLGLGRFEWWQAGGRLVGLAAAIAIFFAYFPPPAIERRFARNAGSVRANADGALK